MGTLNEELQEIKDILKATQEKEKKFRLPFGKKVGRSQRKKNYITLIKLLENSTLLFKKVKIENQTFWEDGIVRLASAGYVFTGPKNNPFIILPSWSNEPFSKGKDFKESIKEGRNVVGQSLILAEMEANATKTKGKMSGLLKWIIILGAGGIILYALLTGGG